MPGSRTVWLMPRAARFLQLRRSNRIPLLAAPPSVRAIRQDASPCGAKAAKSLESFTSVTRDRQLPGRAPRTGRFQHVGDPPSKSTSFLPPQARRAFRRPDTRLTTFHPGRLRLDSASVSTASHHAANGFFRPAWGLQQDNPRPLRSPATDASAEIEHRGPDPACPWRPVDHQPMKVEFLAKSPVRILLDTVAGRVFWLQRRNV